MELSNQQTLPVGLSQAWDALNDLPLLQQCIPGCEAITPGAEAGHHEVQMTAAIGPVKARFKGKLVIEDLQPPASYTLRFEGQGGAAGHGKGTASVRLEAQDAHTTVLHYTAHATVGGKLAQIGSRLVDMAAQKLANEFFNRFNALLQERQAPPAEATGPADTAAPEDADKPGRLQRLFGR